MYCDVYTLTFRNGVTPDEQTTTAIEQGCGVKGRNVAVEQDRKALAALSPVVRPQPTAPPDNPTTPGRVALGKKLFFDTRLSANGKLSCATCHQPDHAFAFPEATAPAGVNGLRVPRNVPTLINAAYRDSLFLDGRAKTLEEQALGPIQHPAEMGSTLADLVKRLALVADHDEAFRTEFGGPITAEVLAKAIASFERTVLSTNTPFDRFARGDPQALSEPARRGYLIFRDKANCITCHRGPDFTDGAFRNLGVGWDGKASKDRGRGQVTGKEADVGKFRVPPLRELRWTAPYMHDGSLKSLDEVVEFYNRGGPPGAKTDLQGPLKLTDPEKQDLVEFLKSLSSDRLPIVLR